MRTTIDLPEDLHRTAISIARDRHQSLSATVSDLIRKGLETSGGVDTARFGERNGFPTYDLGRVITSEDVRSLDDEE